MIKMFKNAMKSLGLYDVSSDWTMHVKKTIKRYSRGNIAAQSGRVLLPSEAKEKHEEARKLSKRWKARYRSSVTK